MQEVALALPFVATLIDANFLQGLCVVGLPPDFKPKCKRN